MNDEKALSTNIIGSMDDAERAAKAMAASGFFPDSRQAAQAIVKILAGQELGFGPFASMTGVNIIQGKPVLGANFMAAAVKRTGKYNYRIAELSDTKCELVFFEGGKEVGRSLFTLEDAKRASLTGKDNWTKYPRNMLFARALSNGQKWYAPDVFNGATVYTPDELGADTDEDGNVIPGTFKDADPIPADHDAPAPIEQMKSSMSLDYAMNQVFTTEKKRKDGTISEPAVAYGTLTDEDLSNRLIGINRLLADATVVNGRREEAQLKHDAIVLIQASRKNGK